MNAPLPDLSINISHRRWACVVDPTVALSTHGLALVQRLIQVMELWVVRELWNILDNTHFYLQEPHLLLPGQQETMVLANDRRAVTNAIRGWEQVRREASPAELGVFWVGDSANESFLPEHQAPSIVQRYECLSAVLDQRVRGDGPLQAAFRDTVALAAATGSGLILSQLPASSDAASPPAICSELRKWGLPCQRLSEHSPLVQLEQTHFLHLLMHAGVSAYCWAGFRPVILHIVTPSTVMLNLTRPDPDVFHDLLAHAEDSVVPECEEEDVWQDTQTFWYPLSSN